MSSIVADYELDDDNYSETEIEQIENGNDSQLSVELNSELNNISDIIDIPDLLSPLVPSEQQAISREHSLENSELELIDEQSDLEQAWKDLTQRVLTVTQNKNSLI